eukprot:c1930_g1_i1.p1 GENE.c1930_g1_i1~~c1930_g1_i1.p1  ORF type:complete len:268 (+),score=50.82 c1930_g1_i1:104-805(+)
MNSLIPEMMVELARVFKELATDKDVRAVILTGAGTKAFSAGVDLTKAGSVFQGNPTSPETNPRTAIENFPWPVIGAINGFAITGGFELALACDILIGSTNAKFADTHAKFGIAPSWGLSQKLSRMIGSSRAKELHFSARFIGAEEAARWGLLNSVVAPEQLLPTCIALGKQIASMQPDMLRRYKRTVNDGFDLSFGEGAALEVRNALEYYKSMTPEQFKLMKDFIASRSKAKL